MRSASASSPIRMGCCVPPRWTRCAAAISSCMRATSATRRSCPRSQRSPLRGRTRLCYRRESSSRNRVHRARQNAQAQLHRPLPGRVRHRPGGREEDPRGRGLLALPQDRAARGDERSRSRKSNVLLIGPSGTGKTLMCETLSRLIKVPFVTADATSLAQTRYVNEEIDAILQRLVDKADGDVDAGADRHRLHRRDRQAEGAAGPAAQHLGRERAARAAEDHGRRAGQARERRATSTRPTSSSSAAARSSVSTRSCRRPTATGSSRRPTRDNQNILDRLNTRVKPTDLFEYGLIPEFTGRLPIVATLPATSRGRCWCGS